MYAHQFWCVWLLLFWRFYFFLFIILDYEQALLFIESIKEKVLYNHSLITIIPPSLPSFLPSFLPLSLPFSFPLSLPLSPF